MLEKCKTVVIHNIIAPYKSLLFNELARNIGDLTILYMAERESNRDWAIRTDLLQYPYDVLFKGSLDDVSQVRVAMRTWNWLNGIGPDVVIIGGYKYLACWAALFWARAHKRKTILWSCTTEGDRPRPSLKEKIKGVFVKRCDASNVYGEGSKDYLVKLGMRRDSIFTKGNATDNDFYYRETTTLRTQKGALARQFGVPCHNFLYVGRFSEEKNILHLLQAYQQLRTQGQWGLILVGDGPQRELIESHIRKHAIENVLMPGFQQIESICQFFVISDVLVLPSISETWGLVVNEAMAAGLPVLVSRKCGCYPDIIKDDVNGFSFDPYDETELYSRMRDMADSKYDLTTMGKASLEIIKEYTLERAARTVARTVEYVLRNGGSQGRG